MTAAQQKSRMQQVQNQIAEFQAAKDEAGNPVHPHFETVQNEMARLIQAGVAGDLKDAYDKAVWANPDLRAQQLEAERKAADVRLRAERRTGELLKELARAEAPNPEGAGGKSRKIVASDDATQQRSEYSAALDSAGLSRQTANRYQQLANVPDEQFERHLADPVRKPTTNGILRESRKDTAKQIDPQALRIWGMCRDMERHDDISASPSRVFNEMTETMQADIRRLAPMVIEFFIELSEVANQ